MPQTDPPPLPSGLPRPTLGALVAIGLLYGSCGGALTGVQASVMATDDTCLGPWSDQLLCDPGVTWSVSALVCVVVPIAVHALLLPHVGRRLLARCFLGVVSVVASVVVTFGCWRLLLDVPLLWAGWGYLVHRYPASLTA